MTIVAYFQTSFSHVKNVEISGNVYVPEEWIVEQSELLPEVSMWLIDGDVIQEKLLSHPEIEAVSLVRQWPNTVSITIEEYERIAYVEEGESFYPLLSNGVTLRGKEYESVPFDAPILAGFGSTELKEEMAKELNQVAPSLRQRISEIYLTPVDNDPSRLTIFMNDGFLVSSTVRRFAERIGPYPSVVEQLDVNVEGIVHMRMNPYFEPFEKEEEDSESEG
ncbi:MAG: FtsQ-type POTRA domain-containing protein [Bacillus sp. (in: Bacteria)]|nr:FtsQ-type POTRA domain-containing protein [Bacillus sp. (in: firmicutes)]